MISRYFRVDAGRLGDLQEVVKAANVRFLSKPLVYRDSAWVAVGGDLDEMLEFDYLWRRMTTPIREAMRKVPWWKRLWRRLW